MTYPAHGEEFGALKRAGADDEAVAYLVGHALPGTRAYYVAAEALPLEETVALIPPIVEVEALKVVPMRRQGQRG